MENITLGQVLIAVVFILSFVTNIRTMIKELSSPIDKKIEKAITPIKESIAQLELNNIKTDLVNFMSLADRECITEEQKINAYELYDRYCKLGGNSYIHDKFERLKKEGKI